MLRQHTQRDRDWLIVRAYVGERQHDVVDRSNQRELVAGDLRVVPKDRRDRPARDVIADSKLVLVPFHAKAAPLCAVGSWAF